MTIHDTHPFADPEPDPVRRLRGRVGATVSLWTSGDADSRAGLPVSSYLVAAGSPALVLGLVDPEADLLTELRRTGRGVLSLLQWPDRDLADAFAGTAPAPGGPFRLANFVDTPWGPRPARATTWTGLELTEVATAGWSALVTLRVAEVEIGDDPDPLVHRRGRYRRAAWSGHDDGQGNRQGNRQGDGQGDGQGGHG